MFGFRIDAEVWTKIIYDYGKEDYTLDIPWGRKDVSLWYRNRAYEVYFCE